MPYIILACAAAALLLLGCSRENINTVGRTIEEKQEQAVGVVESAAAKLRATTTELSERAKQVERGVEGVKGAVTDLRESAGEIKEALE
jgi:hypothetical protein